MLVRRPAWALTAAAVAVWSIATVAQVNTVVVGSLKTVPVPRAQTEPYVRDPAVLLVLGKALFWDIQVGSDNRTACGTCHFHAGADHRNTNQLSSPQDATHAVPLNRTLSADDFPFRVFANPLNKNSTALRDTRLSTGSAGVPLRQFVAVPHAGGADAAADPSGLAAPAVGGLKVRQVTPRNTPSVINAVFNARNFWDGRASNIFTGRTPFGDSDSGLNLLVATGDNLVATRVSIENSSLASVAVAPPVNAIEMSFDGRSLATFARRILPLVPLAQQQVAADDSVLGPFAGAPSGLRTSLSYAKLVRAAFVPSLWQSTLVVNDTGRVIAAAGAPRNDTEFTQMEYNFPLFWALALQAYQASLVADNSRFDQFADGNTSTLNASEQRGLIAFQNGTTQCFICHRGPEMTTAGLSQVARRNFVTLPSFFGLERTGDTPTSDDIGAAGVDTFGRQFFAASSVAAARGMFKIPGLRNVELTGPYFHSGSMSTLQQVLEFYARGGGPDGDNLNPIIGGVTVNAQQRTDLLAFMLALTDDRVRFERAPFDHPAICVPHGHPQEASGALRPNDAFPGAPIAADAMALVPAVGAGGSAVPLQTFEELLRGIGNDGSRAHTMTTPCTISSTARIRR